MGRRRGAGVRITSLQASARLLARALRAAAHRAWGAGPEVVRARAHGFTCCCFFRIVRAVATVLEAKAKVVRCPRPLGYPSRSGVHAVYAFGILRAVLRRGHGYVKE